MLINKIEKKKCGNKIRKNYGKRKEKRRRTRKE